jgi:hypothetical protein
MRQDCRRTTLWRKIQEVPFAFAMELRYSKDEILSIYLNRAYLGAGARGFEAAAQRYFGVSAAARSGGRRRCWPGFWWRRPITRRPRTLPGRSGAPRPC